MSNSLDTPVSFASLAVDLQRLIFRLIPTEELFTIHLVCKEWSLLVWDSQYSITLPSTEMVFWSFSKLRELRHLVFDLTIVKPPTSQEVLHRKVKEQVQLKAVPPRDLLQQVAFFENLLSLTFVDSVPAASFTTFIYHAFGYSTSTPGKLVNLRRLQFWTRLTPGTVVLPVFDQKLLAVAICKTCKNLTVLRIPYNGHISDRDTETVFRELCSLTKLTELSMLAGRYTANWSCLSVLPKLRKLVLGDPSIGYGQALLDRCLNKETAVPLALGYCVEGSPILSVLPEEYMGQFLEIVSAQERQLDREYVVDFLQGVLRRGHIRSKSALALLQHPQMAAAAKKPAPIDVDLNFVRLLSSPFATSLVLTSEFFEVMIPLILAPYVPEGSTVCDVRRLPLFLRAELRSEIAKLTQASFRTGPKFFDILPYLSGLFSTGELLSIHCRGGLDDALKILDQVANRKLEPELPILFDIGSLFTEPLAVLASAPVAVAVQKVWDKLIPLYKDALLMHPAKTNLINRSETLRGCAAWAILSMLQHGILQNLDNIPPVEISSLLRRMSLEEMSLFSRFIPPELASKVPFPPTFQDPKCIRIALEMGFQMSSRSNIYIVSQDEVISDLKDLLVQRWIEQNNSNPAAIQALLNDAIIKSNKNLVEYLVLTKGAKPNVPDQTSKLPIFCALESAGNHRSAIIEFLLQQGADINARALDGTGETPLIRAARLSEFQLARSLILTHGADGSLKDSRGKSFLLQNGMLEFACEPHDPTSPLSPLLSLLPLEIIKDVDASGAPLLIGMFDIEHRIDLRNLLRCRSDWDLLARHPISGKSFMSLLAEDPDLSKILAVMNFVTNHFDKASASAFLVALSTSCALGFLNTKVLEDFLDVCCSNDPKFNVNCQQYSRKRRTALHEVADLRAWKLIARLLELGADVSLVDDDGSTPLMLICKPSISQPQSQRTYPFMAHFSFQPLALSRFTAPIPVPTEYEKNAGDIITASKRVLDVRDKADCEAILYAFQSNCFPLVRQIVEAGAQWVEVGPEKRSLITECVFKQELLTLLLDTLRCLPDSESLIKEALKHRDIYGMTPLEHGCKCGQINFVRALCELGADAEALEGAPFSPLSLAAQFHTESTALELCQFLVDESGVSAGLKLQNGKIAAELTAHESIRRYLSSKAGVDPDRLQAPHANRGGFVLISNTELVAGSGQRDKTSIVHRSAEERRRLKEEEQRGVQNAFKFDTVPTTLISNTSAKTAPVAGFSFASPPAPTASTPTTSPPFAFSFGMGEIASKNPPPVQSGMTNPTSEAKSDSTPKPAAPAAFQFSLAPSSISFDVTTLPSQASFAPKKKDRSFKNGTTIAAPILPSASASDTTPPK
eukprot:TRINITY_DN4670_c0_g1_i1.p1 TRINITY_DN4670_c0_g1~~TRINITY_DN4670_c0_g1_i1.p1  ORF type:complete len:1363 (+),score=182.83 TRINITY_DN4670_c0_g1_i1:30-4118(+)